MDNAASEHDGKASPQTSIELNEAAPQVRYYSEVRKPRVAAGDRRGDPHLSERRIRRALGSSRFGECAYYPHHAVTGDVIPGDPTPNRQHIASPSNHPPNRTARTCALAGGRHRPGRLFALCYTPAVEQN
jgi:hypothetical protein